MENIDFIRPSADLRNKYSEMSRLCKQSREPIYITVNGRGDTVLLDMAEFIAMKNELQLLKELSEADTDIQNGRVGQIADLFANVRNTMKEIENAKL